MAGVACLFHFRSKVTEALFLEGSKFWDIALFKESLGQPSLEGKLRLKVMFLFLELLIFISQQDRKFAQNIVRQQR